MRWISKYKILEKVWTQYQSSNSNALKCYASDEKMIVEAEEAQEYAEYMLGMIGGFIA